MKKNKIVIAILILISIAIVAGATPPFRPALDRWRTMASVRLADDYPLYVMHYYGDYGFDDAVPRLSQAPHAPAWACTTFAALSSHGDRILGRSFDWKNRPSLLLFTDPPTGYASVSMVDASYLGITGHAPSWANRARLLDAPYLPFDGMNERGLAVGMMAVPHAQSAQGKATIDSLLLIRLLLDRARDVDQAVALIQDYTVDFGGGPPLHYLLADASGRAVVVEFINRDMRVLPNENPWHVATNFVLQPNPPEGATSSCPRYNLAYETLARAEGHLDETECMDLLRQVSQPNTMWSVVYNMTTGGIDVAVGRQYERVHHFELK